ncbi:MAG: ATP-binding cassette domain-containing protein [Candidatus Woesearchaeota archaeon]
MEKIDKKIITDKFVEKDKTVISVVNLSKIFKVKTKEEGVFGSIKSVFSPKYKNIDAVKNISFSVKEGELVAFIGPNGAGKSTTLKMLSGILFNDGGFVRILGLDPQKDRQKMCYSVGTVFGQKPQLWFHLPAIDSFNLFAKIYDLDPNEYKKRLNYLIDSFEIKEFLNQPVRKLSLGQRMRCEIVLSLLHKPRILFLDEPTIGLDIVVKKSMRELIKKINREEKVTVILTSHDMQDVESICDRAIIINKGVIVYDGFFDSLKKKYLSKKVVHVLSESKLKFIKTEGVKIVSQIDFEIKFEIDTKKASLQKVIDSVMKKNVIEDITIEEAPIEDVIERIYTK